MNAATAHKVTAAHLKREAYLYVRQSTLRQVVENTESTKRQYALRERAVALGWPRDRIVVIDCDLGQSGTATDREGFQKLVAAVGMGQVGVVLGLEVSRLARNSVDWQRLLEICALTDTLILDEDGVYNPGHFNDRLLLGLKGTMSEAELHVLRARLRGGILSKAARGELKVALPVGLVHTGDDRVVLDPDQQVQQALRLLFETFRRAGSASATVRCFREQGLLFPSRVRSGPRKGETAWSPLTHWRTLRTLKNPRYAGAFVFGQRQVRHTLGKTSMERMPQEEWHALVPDAHPGYISWREHEDNVRRLRENAQAQGGERRKSPPREGPALLQGLVICGVCGERMTVRYHQRATRNLPMYVCQKDRVEHAEPVCQSIHGGAVDDAIGELLVEAMTPFALEVALTVQRELDARAAATDQLRRQQVERARYEAELAQRRYLRVDPDNRLVASSLEAEWNDRLRALAAAQEEYERQQRADGPLIDERSRATILALATDFPRLWRDPGTSDRQRKRMVRLIVEDVTLVKAEQITAHVRFRGGATRTLTIARPLTSWQLRQYPDDVVAEIDRLLDHHTDGEIADILTRRGLHTWRGKPLTRRQIMYLRIVHGLPDRFTRLRRAGLLTLDEIAGRLGVHPATVKTWQRAGLLVSSRFSDKGERLYHPPGPGAPVRWARKKLPPRVPAPSFG